MKLLVIMLLLTGARAQMTTIVNDYWNDYDPLCTCDGDEEEGLYSAPNVGAYIPYVAHFANNIFNRKLPRIRFNKQLLMQQKGLQDDEQWRDSIHFAARAVGRLWAFFADAQGEYAYAGTAVAVGHNTIVTLLHVVSPKVPSDQSLLGYRFCPGLYGGKMPDGEPDVSRCLLATVINRQPFTGQCDLLDFLPKDAAVDGVATLRIQNHNNHKLTPAVHMVNQQVHLACIGYPNDVPIDEMEIFVQNAYPLLDKPFRATAQWHRRYFGLPGGNLMGSIGSTALRAHAQVQHFNGSIWFGQSGGACIDKTGRLVALIMGHIQGSPENLIVSFGHPAVQAALEGRSCENEEL
eukprot:TRINITY_DN12385_c0_g1_i1.p1 TRINITY_DN12385_c0_g1~~TRINITY_DN12385_c0_g1_i1.p1  ORF type:complete len:360 (+),score=35.71 TRINITY_DN12385_c0_g1_i1:36-1082(+)